MKLKSAVSLLFPLLVCLIIIISLSGSAFSQGWQIQTSNSNNNLRGVSFVDPTNGWTVGDSGTILKTTNGGLNWIRQNIDTTNLMFNAVTFKNLNFGWVVGDSSFQGIVFRTTNGGTNWIRQSLSYFNYRLQLNSVSFTDLNHGWIAGSYLSTSYKGIILKTVDGGISWTTSFAVPYDLSALSSISFCDSLNGWAVGGNYDVCHTSNGGTTWVDLNGSSDLLYVPVAVSTLNPNTCWIGGGQNGRNIWRTTDNGTTWNLQTITAPNQPEILGISFIDTCNGLLIRNDGTGHTTNGGLAWNWSNSGGGNAISFLNPVTSWSVGNSGSIVRYYGGIVVAKPNGNELFTLDLQDTIKWYSSGFTGGVSIDLNRSFPSSNWEPLFSNITNSGNQIWTVTSPYTANARIRITSVDYPTVSDTSDADFVIGIVPAPPGNFVVTTQGEDAHLSWARVDTSISGFPISVQRYIIYYRSTTSNSWQYLWYALDANDTSFTHVGVVRFSPAMYYQVTAWIGGSTDSFDRIIRTIPVGTRKEDVERMLNNRW